MTKVRKIEKSNELPRLLRVAAYARVSTEKDAMLHSLNSQVDFYKEYISKNPQWIFKGVFADYATTGTKEDRREFQALLALCRNKQIDLIITKSISRFARNIVTTLETTRELKRLGIDIYFEEQNLHSLSADGELILTLLANFAQEESRSASENLKWRIRKGFEQGKPWQQSITGYKFVSGNFEIIPEEAETVRKIYSLYLSGLGLPAIAKQLESDGVVSKRNRSSWNINSIRRILTCYTYTGNLILQTTYKNNHIEKRKMQNNGELNKYHVEGTHEAIIPLEQWMIVQAEIKRRDSLINHTSNKNQSLFAGLLICSHCGKHYTRKVNKYGCYYICPTFAQKGKAYCESKQVREEPLIDIAKSMLKKEVLSREDLVENIDRILVCDNNILIFKLKDGTEVAREWKYRSRSESWTPEMKAKAAIDAKKKGNKQHGESNSNTINN